MIEYRFNINLSQQLGFFLIPITVYFSKKSEYSDKSLLLFTSTFLN